MTSRRRTTRLARIVTGVAFAALALSACDPFAGETTIGAPASSVEPVALEPAALEVAAVEPAVAASANPSTADPVSDDVVVLEGEIMVVDDEATGHAASSETSGGETSEIETSDIETADFEQTSGCMDGRWMAAPGEIELYFATIGLSTQTADTAAINMNASGYIIIVLEGGHYSYDARIVNQINVDGFPTTSVVEGVTSGSYSYQNGFIVATEEAGSLDAYVDFGGTRIDAAELGQAFAQTGFREAPYDCNGDNPSIFFDVAPGVARYEMKFIPWDGSRS